jgi:HEAT repeat-containing protein 5
MLHAAATVMKTGEPSILLAMDGQDNLSAKPSATLSKHEEPAALFFAVFGLVYEALAVSSADSAPSPKLRADAIVALETLSSLVKPEYSGKALLDPPIFDEFIGLAYRMSMTEPSSILSHLVETIAIFTTSQKERMLIPSVR